MLENIPKAIIIGSCFAMVMVLLHSVSAQYCFDNNTATGNVTIDGTLHYFNISCDYGCENGECNPTPLIQYLIIIGVIVLIVIIVILIKKAGLLK